MAFRHRQHLIFKYLQLIFEGTDGKEKVSAVTTYILGVAERSEEEFLKQIQDTTFTIKPEVMSTLEQILERGRKEGLEKGIEKGMDRGVYKNSIFNLLKTAVHFPDWPAEKLADFTELSMEIVATFLSVQSEGDAAALNKYVREDLLTDIPLSGEEEEKLHGLISQLVDG
jgi:flagellar biosynthesis/type III secretory pathway protein FliH